MPAGSCGILRPMTNILIIKLGAFGDIMQAEGALHDIRNHHPEARIAIMTMPAYKGILSRCPWIDEVIVDPRAPRWRLDAMWQLGRTLRAHQFDMVYDLQNASRTASYFRWFFSRTPWSGTATGCSHPHRAPNPKSIRTLDRLAGQLEDAGLTIKHTRQPDMSWLADDVTSLLTDSGVSGKYIVLIPGCSARHPQKRWPHYDELARLLSAEGLSVVMAPGPDERDLAKTIPAIDLTRNRGLLSWSELAGLLKGAACVIGNDTGPTHLAAHIGAPLVALFGPYMVSERTGIHRSNVTALDVLDLASLPALKVIEAVKDRLKA